jgi:hypothetical protein
MKVRILTIFLFLYCCALASSCNNHSESLQEGDLLFQNLNCGELCDAIEKVTDGVNGKDFSHCAIVVNSNDTLKVIEAIGDKVQINSLNNFFARSGDTASIKNVTIGRVKHHHESLLNDAMIFTKKQIGQPYDSEFLLENDKWYCSELLYQAFKEANNQKDFFELEPMTFRDPNSKAFFPAWIKHYKELGKDIPEGKQGINPGLISRSDQIRIINTSDYGKL